ncbi:LOW QUALITY PROTEIN: uncharacterized protein zgc:66455 [Lates calcarifer]|uniref:LOW QUALITY PROTEIN: uncharacterized protein zgc:66455 n=1 Tax=Lates calcarifer TaxID=8187 RepID=A0AAJ7PL63_LATCA|nr:LOW QUALITY PROTEIN: uncharacterized protein zgc:66455 [Lates calcarifer]
MLRKKSFNFRSVQLIFLLISWKHVAAQVNTKETNKPPDGHGGEDSAFFALRSCHQLLHADHADFFSPDYLCSNPSLWCNWTIQVDPGKRIHLQLEDLTPDDACHLKQDQLHVDDPAGGHKVLLKCWREAKYTSASNTLSVVLLIAGWPEPPYRGFHGRYQTFGPPVVYNPQELGPVMDGEQEHLSADVMYDYYDQQSAMMEEPDEAADTDTEVGENLHSAQENFSHVYPFTAVPTVPVSTQGTSRSGRGVAPTLSVLSDSTVHPESPQQQQDGQNQETTSTNHSPTAAARRDVEETSTHPEGGRGCRWREQTEVEYPSTSERPEPEETHPQPNMVEPLSDLRGNIDVRNHSEVPHLPGDHLFEVAVEVNLSQDLDESWDGLARSLLLSVKTLISEQLEALHSPPSISTKRIKRLSAGVLYILWLQMGQGSGSQQVHRAVHSAMQGLVATSVGLRGLHRKAVILSVSTADVNECGTQMVLCDVNADCVNQFGSYSCHCRSGFLDQSRLGSGGTVCVDMEAAGCSSGLSPETKGVYVLFFLLSSLVLMLLVAAGMLYHRHHHKTFLVRCHSNSSISHPDANDNNNSHQHHDSYSNPADSDLPPPPPPARGPRGRGEGWPQVKERCPAVDLPLLRFSPLLPPNSYMEPREGGKI